jgi:hypothetical protein
MFYLDHSSIVLVFCSRLPVLSSTVLSSLEKHQIYPYGYPYIRTLPFRYFFERRVRNNRSTNAMSELWKKKLLDAQRSHVLKGSNCTVKNIKYYFEQIWSQIINENQDDDDDNEQKSFEDKCQQAFQQANIQIKITKKKNSLEKKLQLTPKKKSAQRLSTELIESTAIDNEIMDELNHLLTITSKIKEHVYTANSSQILKMNNHIQQSTDCKFTKFDILAYS